MKKTLLLSLIIYISPVGVSAQRSQPPRFEDYPVKEKFRGKPARINYRSCSLARTFRTMLSAAAVAPTFAGPYGVNTWGCGSGCIQIGIVDLRDGRVYMPGVMAHVGVEFRIGSRLIIVNPPAKLKEEFGDCPPPADYLQTQYYLWNGSKLSLIHPPELKGKFREALKSCPP